MWASELDNTMKLRNRFPNTIKVGWNGLMSRMLARIAP